MVVVVAVVEVEVIAVVALAVGFDVEELVASCRRVSTHR